LWSIGSQFRFLLLLCLEGEDEVPCVRRTGRPRLDPCQHRHPLHSCICCFLFCLCSLSTLPMLSVCMHACMHEVLSFRFCEWFVWNPKKEKSDSCCSLLFLLQAWDRCTIYRSEPSGRKSSCLPSWVVARWYILGNPKTNPALFVLAVSWDLTRCIVLNHVDGKAHTFRMRVFFFIKFDCCKLEGLMLEEYGAIIGFQVSWPWRRGLFPESQNTGLGSWPLWCSTCLVLVWGLGLEYDETGSMGTISVSRQGVKYNRSF